MGIINMRDTISKLHLKGRHIHKRYKRNSLVRLILGAAIVVYYDFGWEQPDIAGILHGTAKRSRQQLAR